MGKKSARFLTVLGTSFGAALYLTGAAGAAPPAPGVQASTLVVKSGTTITVTAGVGRSNTITVRQVGNTIRVTDSGDVLAAFGGCSLVSATEASCPAAGLTELVVYAGDQNDQVRAAPSSVGVTLIGGPGDDELFAGSTNDTLEGDDGNDFLSGGDGNDTLTGGRGADRISGGGGNDSIEGGSENDLLAGAAGNDVINGGPGNDQLHAGAGNDYAAGEGGNDAIHAEDGVFGNDFADGGAGTDTCTADLGDSVSNCP